MSEPSDTLTGDAQDFNDLFVEGQATAAAQGQAPPGTQNSPFFRNIAEIVAPPRPPPSDTTEEFSKIEIPQTPPPGRRNPNALDDAHAIRMERRRLAALADREPPRRTEAEQPTCRPAVEEPEVQPDPPNPTFILIVEPARPIGLTPQVVRIHLFIPHAEHLKYVFMYLPGRS